MMAVIGVAMLGGIAFTSTSASAVTGTQPVKAWVCKYEGKPGVNETLKNGKDGLVWVSVNSLEVGDPTQFKDGQDQSFVLAIATEGNTVKGTYTGGLTCPAPRGKPVIPPDYTLPTCDAPSTIIRPVDTDYYTWVLNEDDNVWTAMPKDVPTETKGGSKTYTLNGKTQFPVSKNDQLTGKDCVIKVLEPIYTPPDCFKAGALSVPNPVGYGWNISDKGIYTAVVNNKNYTLDKAGPFGPFPLAQLTGAQCPGDRTIIRDVPGISLVKSYTLNGTDALADVGETISYSFLVTNTGNVALSNVAVVDLMTGVSAVSCPSTTLAVAATFTCTASYIVTPANVTGADIVNKANASGKPPTGVRVDAAAFVNTPTAKPVVAPTVLGVVKDVPVKAAPVAKGVVKDAVKTLAFTGAETVPLSLSGLLALLLGAVLTVASRRQGGKEARE